MTLYEGYIQMTFFSQDSQVGVPRLGLLLLQILDDHIFLNLSLFGACKGNIL